VSFAFSPQRGGGGFHADLIGDSQKGNIMGTADCAPGSPCRLDPGAPDIGAAAACYGSVFDTKVIDEYLPKIEELVARSKGRIGAGVVHEKAAATRSAGTDCTTRRAVAADVLPAIVRPEYVTIVRGAARGGESNSIAAAHGCLSEPETP
jgi:hypothetical protein